MATRGRVTAGTGAVVAGATHTLGSDTSKGLSEGGGGKDGHLNLLDHNNKLKVSLVAKEAGGKLTLNGSNEKQRIKLEGESARLLIGGNGVGGNISLARDDVPTGAQLASKSSIQLDGQGAKVFIGANGVDGSLMLFDGGVTGALNENKATIWLSGNSGDIILRNADCAEEFDIDAAVEVIPGTVMVLNQEGKLQPSGEAYDKRVAGVISGAGDYKPGIVLDRQEAGRKRLPLALVGKVFCQVDAQFSPIEVGDLLTTSPTSGHAMRAGDPLKAFGAVIGKALRPLTSGRGLIPILIALQ